MVIFAAVTLKIDFIRIKNQHYKKHPLYDVDKILPNIILKDLFSQILRSSFLAKLIDNKQNRNQCCNECRGLVYSIYILVATLSSWCPSKTEIIKMEITKEDTSHNYDSHVIVFHSPCFRIKWVFDPQIQICKHNWLIKKSHRETISKEEFSRHDNLAQVVIDILVVNSGFHIFS